MKEYKPEGYFKCFNCGIENVFYKKDFVKAWDRKTFYCSFCQVERVEEKLTQGELFKNE